MGRFVAFIIFAVLIVIGGLGYITWTTSYASGTPSPFLLPFDINYQQKKYAHQEGRPARLTISKLSLDAPVEEVELDTHNHIARPLQSAHIGWYSKNYKVGEKGSVVIAGDIVQPDGSPGVFANIYTLSPGELFAVRDMNGKDYTYEVIEVIRTSWQQAPKAKLLLKTGDSYVNLLTYDAPADYADREAIVFGKLVRDK